MLRTLYSMLLRIAKGWFRPKSQEMSPLAKHWSAANIEGRSSLLPLPPAAALEIARMTTMPRQEVLDGIHKRLSTLEEKILGKSCPSSNQPDQSMMTPNV